MRPRETGRRYAAVRNTGLAMTAALASALALLGCAAPRAPESRLNPNTLDDDAFLGYLADQPLVGVVARRRRFAAVYSQNSH